MFELWSRLLRVRWTYTMTPNAAVNKDTQYMIRFFFLVDLFFCIRSINTSLIIYTQKQIIMMKVFIRSRAPNEKKSGPSA